MANRRPDIGLQVSTDGIHALVRFINAETSSGNGAKRRRRELANAMRDALTPYAANAKSAVMGLPSRSATGNVQRGLRQAVAKKIRPVVYLTGKRTGAGIRATRTPNYRGFSHSPKALEGKGWNHPIWGRGDMTQQSGRAGWFIDAVSPSAGPARQAIAEVMEEYARRIARGGPFE